MRLTVILGLALGLVSGANAAGKPMGEADFKKVLDIFRADPQDNGRRLTMFRNPYPELYPYEGRDLTKNSDLITQRHDELYKEVMATGLSQEDKDLLNDFYLELYNDKMWGFDGALTCSDTQWSAIRSSLDDAVFLSENVLKSPATLSEANPL